MRKTFYIIFLYVIVFITSVGSWFFIHYKYKEVSKEINHQTALLLATPIPEPQFVPPSLSLKQIFGDNHSWTATLSAQKVKTLIVTGDVIPARSVNYKTVAKNDFLWPYKKTADVLKDADITFINLETPLIANCPLTNEGLVFCGDARNIEGLKFAGVDVVTLANNHAGNWGIQSVKQTIKSLNRAGIFVTGTTSKSAFGQNGTASPSANIVSKNIGEVRFAFLGYDDIGPRSPAISWSDKETIQQEINRAKQKAGVVVVAFHWGVEYTSQPTQRQKQLAYLAIDSGADLIVGNHPHWIQPVEIYKGKLIVYAHGNFVFDQMWSQKTREGVVGKYTFYEDKLIAVEFLPIQIDDYGQPRFVTESHKKKILDEMQKESLTVAPSPSSSGSYP